MPRLFDKHLKAMLDKPQTGIVTYSDGDGLGARVSLTGKIRWQYRYKINNKNKRFDLGDYPELSLSKAREVVMQCRSWLADGLDPKHQRTIQMTKTLNPVTVKEALEYWLVEYAEGNRANVEKHRAQFKRHIYSYIGDLPIEQLETRQWLECFDRIRKGVRGEQKSAPVAAGYILQNTKQALRFCRVRHYAHTRALDDLMISDVGSKQRKKDRVLTDKELADVWGMVQTPNARYMAYYPNLIKLLIIFGARTQEIRLSTWDEWDFEQGFWTVPKSHSKTDAVIIRPIPVEIVSWLLELKSMSGNEYVLGELKSPEAVSVQGGKMWKRLDHKDKWTLHDLRRTLATKLNDLGVAPHVVEQLLGHSLGGVMAIYNRSQYLPEKKAALELWLDRLDLLINPADNVLVMKQH
ncbi:tyrosine-type recombinase/integrase [Photobacterium kishitanii]|uniref:tyrosine-type recombinase/integrase n=2 Tax=Photobacterium kishitanii TaxID=318456 RepID=UPI00043540C1|nr:site-specific integrase [Photobacterium kishitanii]CEO40541.1 Integrase of prophage [Photobacterium kishitanii]